MPNQIDRFIANIKTNGLARLNRYKVFFVPPVNVEPNNLENILLLCDQAQLPGLNYSTVPVRTFGEFRETPYERLYDTANFSFLVDQNMYVKFMFDAWMYQIQDFETKQFNYYSNYITDIEIHVEDLEDNSKYKVVLYEAYPKTIGPVQMDYASKDIMRLNVTMQYRNWESFIMKDSVEAIDTPIDTQQYVDDFINFQNEYSTLFNPQGTDGGGVTSP